MSDSDLSRSSRRLLLTSCAWATGALLLALGLPWIERNGWPAPGHEIPLVLTALLLLANLFFAIRLVGRTGLAVDALPSFLTLMTLAGILNLQVGFHLGMRHYQFVRLPQWYDWLAMPLLEALRAADFLDLLDALQFRLDVILPASRLGVTLGVAFHLIFRLFWLVFAVAAVRGIQTGTRNIYRSLPESMRTVFLIPLTFLTFAVATLILGAFLAAQSGLRQGGVLSSDDLLCCLGQQVVRAVDLASLLPLLGDPARLPLGYGWILTVALLARLTLLVWLCRRACQLGRHISLRLAGGFGLSVADLEEIRRHDPDRLLRVLAGKHLFAASLAETPRLRTSIAVAVGCVLTLCLTAATLATWPGTPGRNEEVLSLASRSITAPDQPAVRALAVLRRLGPYAAPAVPVLGAGLSSVERPRQLLLIQALGDLGPRAISILAECVTQRPALATAAVEALGRIGPPAVPALLEAAATGNEHARDELYRMGARAIPPILARLDRSDAALLVPLLEQIDPTWYRRDPGAERAREVRTARIALALLIGEEGVSPRAELWTRSDPTRIGNDRGDPVGLAPYLIDLGPKTAEAIPVLVGRMADDRTSYGVSELLHGIEQTGPHGKLAVPSLVRLLPRQKGAARIISGTLDRIEPGWRKKYPLP